jgi:tetratricopeptide (TPR) repeat protein
LNRQSFSFEVRGPQETERIRGTTREERARAADQAARTIDADVILYGTISAGTLSPEFYVRSRNDHFKNAEEVTGQYEMARTFLGSQLEAGTGSITDKKTLRDRLGARVQGLAQFVIGLSWYANRDWTSATAAFREALEKGDWGADSGVEVIYVLLGNTAGRLGDLTSSQAAFKRALELNPAYARGHLGAAEVAFLRSKGDCQQGHADETSLMEAEAHYRESLTAGIRPALSSIDAKAAFGLGRVHLCLSQALLADRWTDAVSEFQKVAAEFERGNSSIKELAVEAYGNLGLAALPSEGAANPGPELCNAKSYYQKASDLSDESKRKVLFDRMLSLIAQRLREAGHSCP